MTKVLVSLFVFFSSVFFAHEFNPAHLLVDETKELEYEALWMTPVKNLGTSPELSFPERFTFTHLYFSSERNGKQRSEEALRNIQGNEDTLPKSDPFMLGKNFVEKSRFEIQRDFGNQFSEVFEEPIFDRWLGPVESAYGFHAVKLLNKVESITPSLNQVKEKVEIDFYLEEKQKTLDSYLVELRDKYQVIINPKYLFND